MTVLEGLEAVEVVSAEQADAHLSELRTAIAELHRELDQLASGVKDDGSRADELATPFALAAITATERVVERMVESRRTELRDAIGDARSTAAEQVRVAEARAQMLIVAAKGEVTNAMLRNAGASDEVIACAAVDGAPAVVTSLFFGTPTPADLTPAEPPPTVTDAAAPPAPAVSEPEHSAELPAECSDPPPVTPSAAGTVAEEGSAAYDEFWRESSEADHGRSASGFRPVEALLPALAVLILLVVVLVLIG